MMEVDGAAVENPQEPAFIKVLRERKLRLVGSDFCPKSLKGLCLHSIYKKNLDFFLQMNHITGLNPFDQLPKVLRNELLEKWPLNGWGRCEQLLVNNLTTDLDVSLFGGKKDSKSVVNLVNFWTSLALKQPKLKNFAWSGSSSSANSTNEGNLMLIISISSPQLANLQSLRISNFICSNLHLEMIATHLKNLRVLKLGLDDDITAEGISSLSMLGELQEFLFDSANECRIFNMCLQLLPKLHVVADLQVVFEDFHFGTVIVDPGFKIDFLSLSTPTELGLKQLLLQNHVGSIPDGITMPNLTSLMLLYPFENLQLDARFSNVTELGLFDLNESVSLGILGFLGPQIKKLLIAEEHEVLRLDLYLRLCPKLVELHVPQCPDVVTFAIPLDPETDLKNLEILWLELSCNSSGTYPGLTRGVLVQLLMAPNLRWVKLYNVDMIEELAVAIVSLVEKGMMLQKLEAFILGHPWIDEDDEKLFDQEMKNGYDFVLFNLAKHCPHFVHFCDDGDRSSKQYRECMKYFSSFDDFFDRITFK